MIQLNMRMLQESLKVIRSKRKDIREAADRQYRRQVLTMYREVLMISPQFSGDFVSNWDIETASTSPAPYREHINKASVSISQQPRDAGDTDGPFQSALMRGIARLRYVKYGDPVDFVNNTPIRIESPEVVGADGKRQDLRNTSVITAWQSINSYLQAKYGD